MAATFSQTRLRSLGNLLIAPAAKLGLAGKRTHILTVRGRKSGRPYSTPVQLVLGDGERWLVAPYGEREWVKNARAAGEVELTRARRTTRHRVEELGHEEAAPVLWEYLRKTPIVKAYFDAAADDPVEAFVAEAATHPVFRLLSPGSSGTVSPGSRPSSTARVTAAEPKRSRTSSSAASRAPRLRRSNGSASWTAPSSSRLPTATPTSVRPSPLDQRQRGGEQRARGWRGSSASGRSRAPACASGSPARSRRSAAAARPCGRPGRRRASGG